MIASDDCVIPPQSHSKIKLQSTALSKLELQGVKDDFAFISSIQDQRVRTFKTAYGTSSLTPEWVQLANPTDDPIFIKKGEVVAHLRATSSGGCSVRERIPYIHALTDHSCLL